MTNHHVDPLVRTRAAAGKLYELLKNARRNDVEWLTEVADQAYVLAEAFGHAKPSGDGWMNFWWALRMEAQYQQLKPDMAKQGVLMFSRKEYLERAVFIRCAQSTVDFITVHKHPAQYVMFNPGEMAAMQQPEQKLNLAHG